MRSNIKYVTMILFAAEFTSEKIGTVSFSFFCLSLDAKSFGVRALKIYRGHLNGNWCIFVSFFKCHKHFTSILRTKLLFCFVVFLQMLTASQHLFHFFMFPLIIVFLCYLSTLKWSYNIFFKWDNIFQIENLRSWFCSFIIIEIIASPNVTAVFL